MDPNKFDATMALSDGREAWPNWLWIDADACHALEGWALPSVPLIAIGDRSAPGTAFADLIADDVRHCAALGRAIDAVPNAAAATIQCLRAGEAMLPVSALTLESATMAALQGSAEHLAWLTTRSRPEPVLPGKVVLSRTGARLDIRLDRPAARNAIDRSMRDDLFDAFKLASVDKTVDTIRLTGAGRAFSVGADLAEFGTTRDPATAHLIRLRTVPVLPLLHRTARFEVHVEGACIGSGLELAAFADYLTATHDAWFQLPELGMGILPGCGGTVSIPRRIGRQRAAELIVSARRISARTALAIGLIDRIVDDSSADDCCTDTLCG